VNTQHLISLASFKGGVGKTTVAVHLAGYLAARAPTCVVDGDRTRNATFWHAGGHLKSAVISPSSIAREGRKYEYIPQVKVPARSKLGQSGAQGFETPG